MKSENDRNSALQELYNENSQIELLSADQKKEEQDLYSKQSEQELDVEKMVQKCETYAKNMTQHLNSREKDSICKILTWYLKYKKIFELLMEDNFLKLSQLAKTAIQRQKHPNDIRDYKLLKICEQVRIDIFPKHAKFQINQINDDGAPHFINTAASVEQVSYLNWQNLENPHIQSITVGIFRKLESLTENQSQLQKLLHRLYRGLSSTRLILIGIQTFNRQYYPRGFTLSKKLEWRIKCDFYRLLCNEDHDLEKLKQFIKYSFVEVRRNEQEIQLTHRDQIIIRITVTPNAPINEKWLMKMIE